VRTTAFVFLAAAASVASVPAAEAATCAELLTTAEVKAAAGGSFEDMGPQDRGEGETLCSWMSRGAGGFKTVALTFWSGKGAEHFDTAIASAEEATSAKREALPGAGRRAAVVKYEGQFTAFVETAGGVGQLVTNGLTKAQVAAIATAVAGPAGAAAAIPKEERIEGAAILAHPIGALALRYATALHAKGGDVAALSSTAAQARRKAMPAGERAESDAFMRKMLPAAAALEAGIRAGGVLLIEGGKATLNVVSSQSAKGADGAVTSSSTTSAIAFELEGGAWKLAR
jgi:hypothetical protein